MEQDTKSPYQGQDTARMAPDRIQVRGTETNVESEQNYENMDKGNESF